MSRTPIHRSPLRAGAALAAVLLVSAGFAPSGEELDTKALFAARETITETDCSAHLFALASPELEGRDSPSAGLRAAATYLEEELARAGFRGLGADGGMRHTFTRALPAPKLDGCSLRLEGDEGPAPVLGTDFVPLPGCVGSCEGEALFVGYGIARRKAKFDELKRRDLKGKVAVVLEGEPRHKRLFEGPDELTDAADAYDKVANLFEAGAAGVIIVRRPPAEASKGPRENVLEPPALDYRYTWADWNPATTEPMPRLRRGYKSPVVEVTRALGARLLGTDPEELAASIDAKGKPLGKSEPLGVVRLRTAFENRAVAIENVVAVLPGTDAALAKEVVVVGAHYDHIGVDTRGRVGYGADDNASGVAAVLEVAQAFAAAPPRRSVLVCFFAAEEDGLLGSRALAQDPPVSRESMVAMLNLDMVGRGDEKEVVVLGTRPNPDLEDVLEDALDMKGTRVKKALTNRAEHLWQRSDHYSFHAVGVPVLFLFEAASEVLNPDYHTYRDTIESVNTEKVVNTAQLCFQIAWLLANADERPKAPRDR